MNTQNNNHIIPSHSDPQTFYVVSRVGGQWRCTCDGFGFRGWCSHLNEAMQRDHDADRCELAATALRAAAARLETLANTVAEARTDGQLALEETENLHTTISSLEASWRKKRKTARAARAVLNSI